MRGSGDGEALCPLLYNAGLDTRPAGGARRPWPRSCPRVAVVGLLARGQPRAARRSAAGARSCPRPSRGGRGRLPAPRPRRLRRRARARRTTGSTSTTSCGSCRRATAGGSGVRPDLFDAGPRARPAHGARVRRPDHGALRRLSRAPPSTTRARAPGRWLARDRPAHAHPRRGGRPHDPGGVRHALAALAVRAPRDRADRRPRRVRGPRPQAPGWFWAAERALALPGGARLEQRAGGPSRRSRRRAGGPRPWGGCRRPG